MEHIGWKLYYVIRHKDGEEEELEWLTDEEITSRIDSEYFKDILDHDDGDFRELSNIISKIQATRSKEIAKRWLSEFLECMNDEHEEE